MATYLVTGGCGFIGSHLVDALIARGDRVRVLDDLSTGKRANLAAEAELVIGDVGERDTVESAMAGVGGCFHLAAVASVERSVEDWAGTHRINLTGAVNVFDAARTAGNGAPVPVVYASSAAVYGDNASVPLDESALARPLTPYGADKLGCELHARVASIIHKVPTVGLRFFNVYGPRQDPSSPYSGVISIFADRVLAGRPVTVFGDGQQVRDFVFVGDVVDFLIAAMDRDQVGAQVFNVCSGAATTILQLARTLAVVAGKPPIVETAAPRSGDIHMSLGDPARAAKGLGMIAGMEMGEGLRLTLQSLVVDRANAA
jgi:UDP-glucose 4-epimerase